MQCGIVNSRIVASSKPLHAAAYATIGQFLMGPLKGSQRLVIEGKEVDFFDSADGLAVLGDIFDHDARAASD